MPGLSAVIATYERPEACERALISALTQDPAPLEVLVCDDGSGDDTAERFRAWELRDARVRYLRLDGNTGSPGAARNAGTRAAQGDLVAYLDDDDEWLPGKLAVQLEAAGRADVVATNAIQSDGSVYFADAAPERLLSRDDLLHDNPVIVSSVVTPRSRILEAGGFMTQPWARGVADYAMWLALADRGARFAVLGEPLVRYENLGQERMSAAVLEQATAGARLAWRRVRARPGDFGVLRAACNRSAALVPLAVRHLAGRGRP